MHHSTTDPQTPIDQPLTLTQASSYAPGHPHASTLWRWCRKGVKARNGQRVRLRHQRYGSRVFVTLAGLKRFGEELAAADCEAFADDAIRTSTAPSPSRQATRREQEVSDAEQRLAEDGI